MLDKWKRISQMVFHGGYLENILPVPNVNQDPVLNTKEADVAHGKAETPKCVGKIRNGLRTNRQQAQVE